MCRCYTNSILEVFISCLSWRYHLTSHYCGGPAYWACVLFSNRSLARLLGSPLGPWACSKAHHTAILQQFPYIHILKGHAIYTGQPAMMGAAGHHTALNSLAECQSLMQQNSEGLVDKLQKFIQAQKGSRITPVSLVPVSTCMVICSHLCIQNHHYPGLSFMRVYRPHHHHHPLQGQVKSTLCPPQQNLRAIL